MYINSDTLDVTKNNFYPTHESCVDLSACGSEEEQKLSWSFQVVLSGGSLCCQVPVSVSRQTDKLITPAHSTAQ